MNRYFEYLNGNKYLTLVPTDESKEKNKKYKEMWIKIRDLIRSMTKISNDYDEKYMIIKFNSDEELPPSKTIEIPTMKISFQWRIWGGGALGANALPSKYHVPFSDETEI